MKTYSKEELQAKALEVFEQHPNQDSIFAREDGNVFFDEHYANLDKGKLKVYPFDRADIVKVDVKKIKVVDATVVTEKAKVTTAAKGKLVKEIKGTKGQTDGLFEKLPAADNTQKESVPVAPAQEVKKVDTTLGKDGKNPETRESTNPTA